MNISTSFIRIFFVCLCMFFVTSYISMTLPELSILTRLGIGLFSGAAFSLSLIGIEIYMKSLNLRSFNTVAVGLLFGYIMGEAILLLFQMMLDTATLSMSIEAARTLKLAIILSTSYLGMIMTMRASEEIYVSVPFLKFQPKCEKKKDVILDSSVLTDTRIIDLASSGLLDNTLIFPRFFLCELYEISENGDENEKGKARRSLEVINKLESLPHLNLHIVDTDFPEIKEPISKLVHLSRMLEANIMTTDINRVQQSSIEVEGVRIINLHTLSNALKPLTHAGEFLSIKIQRYGKEARQGVGYLDDGTMVVVNGGADYIGEMIKTQVLSVKHTSSGRMIFCNAYEEDGVIPTLPEYSHPVSGVDNPQKSYFAL